MRHGKMDYPPRKKEEEHEDVLDTGGYDVAEKPTSFDISALTEIGREGGKAEVEEAFDAYIDGWQKYAFDRNLFSSAEMNALRNKKEEFVNDVLATGETKNKRATAKQLKETIRNIEQEIAPALEEAADANYEKSLRIAAGDSDAESVQEKPTQPALRLKTAIERVKEELHLSEDSRRVASKGESVLELTERIEENAESILPLSALKKPVFDDESFNSKAEAKTALAETIGHSETHRHHESLKESIEAAQEEYFSALKEYQQSRGTASLIAEGLTGELSSKKVKELRREWVNKRAELWRSQAETAEERLKDRPRTRDEVLEGLTKYKGKFTKEEILARYERASMVRANIIGREEAEQQAKIDGLQERDRGRFDKLFEQYKKLPAGARIVGTSAALFGVSAVLAGSGIGLTALGLGGASAGARWLAEAKRSTNPRLSAFATGLARLTSVGGIAGLASEGLVKGVHKAIGTETKAVERLEKKEGFGDLSNATDFEKLSRSRKQDLGVKQTIERQGRWARLAGSIGLGSLFGHALHSTPDHPEALSQNSAIETDVPPHPIQASQVELHTATDSHEITMAVGATIHKTGEGTDALFTELKKNIEERGIFNGHESAALKHLLETHPSQLSREMGVAFGEHGATTHMGDQFFVDENQNVWFQTGDHTPQMFIENKPDGHGLAYTVHHEFAVKPLPSAEGHDVDSVHKAAPRSVPKELVPESTYDGPYKEVKSLPEGMDPNSREATEYLNRAYNPSAFETTPSPTSAPHETVTLPHSPTEPEVPGHVEDTPTPSIAPHEADVSTHSPAEPEAPGHAEETPTPEGIIHNSAGYAIDSKIGHVYVGKSEGTFIAYGGTTDQKIAAAQEFYKKFPEYRNSPVYVTGTVPDPITHQPMTSVYHYDTSKGLVLGQVVLGPNGIAALPPTPDDLVKIVN